jgi:hypothetical protein
MDQIENTAPRGKSMGAVPYMDICHAWQASPRRHGYKVCRDLAAGR